MTVFVIGDYHGASIQTFLEEKDPASEDRLFSLGDFDTVESINEFLDFRERFGEENVVDVGGNHDKALIEDYKVTSRTSKTPGELLRDLENDQEAREYLESITQKPIAEFEIGGRKGVLAHAGLTGLVRNKDIPDEIKPFIYRLWEEDHFDDNFDRMDREGYEIMIRGHEHYTEHATRNKDDDTIRFNLPDSGEEYRLNSGSLHILTNGALMDGHYLQIDEEEMIATFQQIY
ncbi:MAG: metallophosphoesterase family protein [Candidatus Nanohaloarchaea archaeon]